MGRDTVIIFNPAAKGEKARRYIEDIRKLAGEAELLPTQEPDDAIRFAAEAAQQGARTVVAAGGDGTINLVANGIAGTGTRLGIIPVGTMNVFASELGLPVNNVAAAWDIVQHGTPRRIDLPVAGGRRFVQMAGVGLDAQVVQETDLEFRKAFGPLSYLMTATQIAARTPPRIRVQSSSGHDCEGSFLLVGNGRYYGGPFTLFNEASPDDGLLDFLLFRNLGYLDIVRYLQGVVTGSHTRMHDVDYFQSQSAHVSCPDTIPAEADGELIGTLPLEFQMDGCTLDILVRPQITQPATDQP